MLNVPQRISHLKRLGDPELAAEGYRQMVRAIGESGYVALPDGMIAPGDALGIGPVRRETARLGVIKRFATRPHYDD